MMEAAEQEPRKLPPRRLFAIANPVLRLLLRSPLHRLMSGRLLLLSFRGRKTGKSYTIPVGYVEHNGVLLLTAQSRWWKNLGQGAEVDVRLRGRTRRGRTEVVRDDDTLLEAFRVMLKNTPRLGNMINIRLDASGELLRADVARAREHGRVIIKVRLTN